VPEFFYKKIFKVFEFSMKEEFMKELKSDKISFVVFTDF
jgi:hypothetical protein